MGEPFAGDGETMSEPMDSKTMRGKLVFAGALAGIAGLAVSHALTALLSLRATPLLAVAEAVIEVTPGPIAEFLIQLVGQWDKPLLIAGVLAGLVALSAWAGVLSRRGLLVAALVFLAMGVVALAAVSTRPDFRAVEVVPVVGGTVVWIIVLAVLVGPVGSPREAPGIDRGRRFLVTAGLAAVGAAVVGVGGELVSRSRRGLEAARRALSLPVTQGDVPPGASFEVPEIATWRTPNPDFYRIDTALVVPEIEPSEWRLRIHGMVESELELSYADLLARELTEDWTTICCVSNPVGGGLIGNAWWSGVRISDLLAETGVLPEADAVLQTSADNWNCGTPIEALTDERGAMVAVAMNGEPLPPEHGFPARMIVPGLYGYVSATKWLVDLEVTRFASFDAYWTERGWSELGPIKTQSRIDKPRPGATVDAGTVVAGGYAWAQDIGIDYVEYRLDGGPWQTARLARVPNVDTWVQWVAEIEVPPGEHYLSVRATNNSGETQTSVRRDVVPDGATGWHTVVFTAQPR